MCTNLLRLSIPTQCNVRERKNMIYKVVSYVSPASRVLNVIVPAKVYFRVDSDNVLDRVLQATETSITTADHSPLFGSSRYQYSTCGVVMENKHGYYVPSSLLGPHTSVHDRLVKKFLIFRKGKLRNV